MSNNPDKPITHKHFYTYMAEFRKDLMGDIEVMFATFGQMIFARFDMQDNEIADLKAGSTRMENKLDATVDRRDDHEFRIRKLEAGPARKLVQ